jgi:hypothetical protein
MPNKLITTMNYNATSVSLRYVPSEDRIEWSSHCGGETMVRSWISRRMLALSLPRLAKWMEGRSDAQKPPEVSQSQTTAEKQHISRFEHETAQQQVQAVQEKVKRRPVDADFLLANLSLETLRSGAIKLSLQSAENTEQVSLKASLPQLHKLVGEMVRLSEAAGWELPNPWQGDSGGSEQAPSRAMH